ncbi:hypothetical protein NDU88_003999 [Pleurodeles waltl]|uniref:Uncharacterized protein n=1 Tax=Pleurodeles waltl TaxID=8319 RepID=A0AAV7W754_PLEWA|nr:hypothetical protein NDU88_003999 [Pleurodeles waltl]
MVRSRESSLTRSSEVQDSETEPPKDATVRFSGDGLCPLQRAEYSRVKALGPCKRQCGQDKALTCPRRRTRAAHPLTLGILQCLRGRLPETAVHSESAQCASNCSFLTPQNKDVRKARPASEVSADGARDGILFREWSENRRLCGRSSDNAGLQGSANPETETAKDREKSQSFGKSNKNEMLMLMRIRAPRNGKLYCNLTSKS